MVPWPVGAADGLDLVADIGLIAGQVGGQAGELRAHEGAHRRQDHQRQRQAEQHGGHMAQPQMAQQSHQRRDGEGHQHRQRQGHQHRAAEIKPAHHHRGDHRGHEFRRQRIGRGGARGHADGHDAPGPQAQPDLTIAQETGLVQVSWRKKQLGAPVWQAGPSWSTFKSTTSPSQSTRASTSRWVWPLVSPFLQTFWRERDQ